MSYDNLVDAYALGADLDLVTQFDTEGSYLWAKLTGTQCDVDGRGDAMPPPYMPDELQRSDEELALIET